MRAKGYAIKAGETADGKTASLHREILSRLRDLIIEGHLKSGERIVERAICKTFGVSRTPIREALKVLASEGLVEFLPNRGACVRELSLNHMSELFDIVGGFDALAGRLACERITAAEFNKIERLHCQMYVFYINGDMPAYFRCNQLIHQRIVAAARNTALSSASANVAGRILRIRYSANLAHNCNRWREAIEEHETMIDSLRRRDSVELSDILFRHSRNNRAAAVDYLAEKCRD
jgi:DNA-binding GntR family transcriptional regulator